MTITANAIDIEIPLPPVLLDSYDASRLMQRAIIDRASEEIARSLNASMCFEMVIPMTQHPNALDEIFNQRPACSIYINGRLIGDVEELTLRPLYPLGRQARKRFRGWHKPVKRHELSARIKQASQTLFPSHPIS